MLRDTTQSMKTKLIFLLFVTLSFFSWTGCASDIKPPLTNLENAQEKVRQNPNDANVHFVLGITYGSSGQYQDAIASLKEAIRIKPNYAAAHYFLGISYQNSGQYQDAIASYMEAINFNSNDAGSHRGLGFVYEKLGRNDEAIAEYKEALRLDPSNTLAKNNLNRLVQILGLTQPSPVISSARELEDAQEKVRQNPNNAITYVNLGFAYNNLGRFQEAITSFKKAIRLDPNNAFAHTNLGFSYKNLGRYQEAVTPLKEAIRLDPDDAYAHYNLGVVYESIGRNDAAIAEYKEALKINPNDASARTNLIALRQKIAQVKPSPPVSQPTPQSNEKQSSPQPQSGTGSGFFVSKMGHVITNAHVVKGCKKLTVGDNANKQVPAELINTDSSNDLALLKLSSLEMASAESKSLIQKLSIVVVPLSSKGLLRSEDVKLGEKVLVAGYPFGELFSNTIKVTSGIVSATRGAGDDSGQFQLDAAVQPGNSGGPIYDSGGNIVGVVISQLDKLKMAKAIGSLPENVNFGIKASTVRQFLTSSGLPSKKSERTEEKSTEQLAVIAQNQALMVMCLQ